MSILDSDSFRAIADLAYRESGLTLVVEKTSMIQSRLRHRLRALNLADFDSYSKLIQSEAGRDERKKLISALTTNVSHFFREKHHFDILVNQILATKWAALRQGGRLRIWSAGCSNGQEAFSIAMSLLEKVPEVAHLDVKILATDIDPIVVQFAENSIYPERLVGGVPKALLQDYFVKHEKIHETSYEAKPILRDMIRFKELNLLGHWPMKRKFDAVFCRNVVIYFDQATQDDLWPRFHDSLLPNGYLFLGHSERMPSPTDIGFLAAGPTSYRRRN